MWEQKRDRVSIKSDCRPISFFQRRQITVLSSTSLVRQGWTVQTNVGEKGLYENSKTIYADCSSQWLRGQDAGSPGAFLHSMFRLLCKFHVSFFFFFCFCKQSRTKELVKEHTPSCLMDGCGWRSEGEAETDA